MICMHKLASSLNSVYIGLTKQYFFSQLVSKWLQRTFIAERPRSNIRVFDNSLHRHFAIDLLALNGQKFLIPFCNRNCRTVAEDVVYFLSFI